MNYSDCPLCQTELEVVDVAPCAECGSQPQEIEHFLAGRHTYAEMKIFGDLSLVLCDFCQVDFSSNDPTYFGLPLGTRLGLGRMQFARSVKNIGLGKDKHCPNCGDRLAWLEFVVKARELHAKG